MCKLKILVVSTEEWQGNAPSGKTDKAIGRQSGLQVSTERDLKLNSSHHISESFKFNETEVCFCSLNTTKSEGNSLLTF